MAKGRRERAVPLGWFPLAVLRECGCLRLSGYLFRRRDGAAGPNQPWLISSLANGPLHDGGVAATLHQCRHWYATEIYRQTRDLRLVQSLLGHATPAATAIYTAYDQGGAFAAVDALPVPRKLRA